MPDLPRTHLAAYALLALVALWFGARQVGRARGGETPGRCADRAKRDRSGPSGRVVVHVAGAVLRPGVYRLPARARVNDAVRRAGGPRRRADLTQVNLAQQLDDGRQIVVPVRTPAGSAPVPGGAPAGPVNLNTATLEQLDTLQGIGPVTAQQILDFREAHGGFRDVAELDQVPGIGEATMASLKDKVTA